MDVTGPPNDPKTTGTAFSYCEAVPQQRKTSLMKAQEAKKSDVPAVLYTVDEAAHALRLSRSVIYELIRSDQLQTVKVGRRRLVPVAALTAYVEAIQAA